MKSKNNKITFYKNHQYLLLMGCLLSFLFSCKNKITQPQNHPPPPQPASDTYNTNELDEYGMHLNDSLYLIGNFAFHARKNMVVDVINNHLPTIKIKSKGDTLFYDKDTTILGDTSKITGPMWRKCPGQKYSFDSYKVKEIYKGSSVKPDFKTDPDAYYFRTAIRWGWVDSVNFAGHYTIIECGGCGTCCTVIAMVDKITGRIFYSSKYLPFGRHLTKKGHLLPNDSVYDWPVSMLEYHKDSRLLMVYYYFETCALENDIPDRYCSCLEDTNAGRVFEWVGDKFIRLE